MDIKASIKKAGDKFQKLPTWGKVCIVGGTGLLVYFLFRERGAGTMSDEEVVFNLPYPDDTATEDGSIFDFGSVGDMTGSGSGEYIDWDSGLGGGKTPLWTYDGGFSSGGGAGANNWGFNTDWGLAGDYNITDEKPVNQPVLVQDNLMSKENTNPNYNLYAAQLAYGSATTQAEREAAARAGELARNAGATDAGAQAIWQANSNGSSGGSTNSNANPNQKLYLAQVAYGNAKTAAERAAAERAGQEARKNGATDAGANAIWQSQSSGSGKTSSKSSSSSVKSSSSSSSSGSSISSADRALQKAQAAYGAAKTSAERAAAAKAGEAARKAGATDKGAQAAWKSLK